MPNNSINTQVWLNTKAGQADGAGPGSDDERQVDVERAINMGIDVYTPGGGIDIQGAGAFSGGKTAYDVGTGFWLGCDEDTLKYEVAIGNPNSNTFNFDGEYIDAQMRNLELTGYLRGPASFTIDPATHGNDTGTVVIAGNLQVDGTTTTINSTVVEIDDIAIQLAAEATTASLANNGGIIVGTFTNYPFILYRSSFDSWEVNKDWTPNTNNTKDLGNTSKRWRNLYLAGGADIEGNLEVDGNVVLGDSTSDTITMNGKVFSDILPAGNIQHDLGAPSLRWRNIYAQNGDFSGDLNVDGNATIGGTITSTGDISSPNMADDLSATVSGSNIDINLLATNNNVLGNVTLAPGSNISLSESSDVITISASQVQSNWAETTASDPSFILNKPLLADDLSASLNNSTNNIDVYLLNSNNQHMGTVSFEAGNNITLSESSDVITISASQVQSNWTETTASDPSFILNKPLLADDLSASLNNSTNNIDVYLLNSNNQHMGTVSFEAGNNITLSESSDVITISASQVQSNWTETNSSNPSFIQNKPTIPAAPVQSNWTETNSSSLSFIQNKPAIPASQVQSNWTETNSNSLSFIQNKPTIPAAPVQSNWTETNSNSLSFIQNKPTIISTFSGLTDTDFTSLADKDIARYNNSTSKWENFSESPVQYTTSFTPSGCSHYKVFVTQKGDLIHLQARFHVSQESNSTSDWNAVLVAPSGYSVPVPPSFVGTPRIATGSGITVNTYTAGTTTTTGLWVATYDDTGTIKVIKHGSTSYASVTNVKANSSEYLLINITFTT